MAIVDTIIPCHSTPFVSGVSLNVEHFENVTNSVLIGSSVFARLTVVTNIQTDHATACSSRPHRVGYAGDAAW